jgi:hypothetical protein
LCPDETVGECLQLFLGEDAVWIGLRRWRGCVGEVIRQEHGQTSGGNAKNETSFRVAGKDGLEKIELFEESLQEPRQIH